MTTQVKMPWGYTLGEKDFLPTPRNVVEALFDSSHAPPRGVHLVESAAGHGAIVEAALDRGWSREDITAVEIREQEAPHLELLVDDVVIGDWFDYRWDQPEPHINITNPPFGVLPEYFLHALAQHPIYCAMLMPIEELAGVQRVTRWLPDNPLTGLVTIPWRPWPNVRGVAWYVWDALNEDKMPIVLP